MSISDPHRENFVPRTSPCRNCGAPIELNFAGCNIHEDVDGVQKCVGYSEFDFERDVALEYDSLCPTCFYDKSIPRAPGLCEVLFEGAEPDEAMQMYLDAHPVVASWRKDAE